MLKICLIFCLVILGVSADEKYDAEAIVDLFYTLNADPKNPHQKINHTNGFCASGAFVPRKNLALNIPILGRDSINATIRYSLGGANKSDKTKGRGMAIKMADSSDSWEIVALNTEINFAKNAKEFYDFFAMRVPKNGKIDSELIARKTREVASFRHYETYLKTLGITPSVAKTAYYAIHTFFIEDKNSTKIPVRFKFEPLEKVEFLSESELEKIGDGFLLKDFQNRLKKGAISYKMIAIRANSNDKIDDTTALWSGTHEEIELGILRVERQISDKCNIEVFMPSMLPQGIYAPQDALFDIRNEVYAITFGRRQ